MFPTGFLFLSHDESEIANLRGSLQPFARGAIVTTSHFSKAAMREASEQGKLPIVLVDGYSFAALVHENKDKLLA